MAAPTNAATSIARSSATSSLLASDKNNQRQIISATINRNFHFGRPFVRPVDNILSCVHMSKLEPPSRNLRARVVKDDAEGEAPARAEADPR